MFVRKTIGFLIVAFAQAGTSHYDVDLVCRCSSYCRHRSIRVGEVHYDIGVSQYLGEIIGQQDLPRAVRQSQGSGVSSQVGCAYGTHAFGASDGVKYLLSHLAESAMYDDIND
jgi:hypothetical protein